MDRRSLLKGFGATMPVAAFSCKDKERAKRVADQQAKIGLSHEELQWDKAPCRYCGTGCGVEVGVAEGKVMAVRGDPVAAVNKGLLCVKGYHLPGLLYGEDRLVRPQRRQPDGSLAEISWEEALDLIAEKYRAAQKVHGVDSVAIYGSGQWTVHDGYAALKWCKAGLRTNNLEPNARLCMASAVAGFMTSFGSDEPMGCYDDFELGDDFVLWGANMAEMHPVLFSRILEAKRVRPEVRVIDLGTRRTPTSDYADTHIQFRPGADLAIANGILHLLVERGQIDDVFVAENVVFRRGIEDIETIGYGCFDGQKDRYGFKDEAREATRADLEAFVAPYTPEHVESISGVPAKQVELLADLYGDRNRGTVSLWCMGVNQHVRGTWMNNLINNLHLLTGKIGRPGANPFSLTGQPSACGTAREVGTLTNRLPADRVVTDPEHRAFAEKLWKVPEGTIPAKPTYHAVDMFRAFARGDIKVLWVQVTNPWQTMPNLARFDYKPGGDQFLIVSDIYPTATTRVADLVLPSAAWVEREGVFGNSERRTQQWNKMVEPPGEAREDAWQIMEVARRMGMGNLFPWPEDSWHEALYEEYRQFSLGTGKDLASYRDLKGARGLRWPVVDGKETRYRYAVGEDPYAKKASGVHFYKGKKYGERAAVWLRPYQPPAEAPDEDYPLWLCTGRVLEHWHTGTMTRRVPQLHRAVPASYVEINRADATEHGISSGDRVVVESRRGRLEIEAVVDGRGRPPRGTLFVPFFDESLLVNLVTLDAMDNISKEPDYKKCAVRIQRA